MTSTPAQPLDLDTIETRAAAATPGPWTVELEQCDCSDGLCSHGTYVSAVYANGERRTEFVDFSDADWQFIIRARTDVPAMAAEIRQARAEIHRLRTELEQHAETLASADNPTRLRWGLGDVLWGDDDSVIVLMSGPDREPYWLELDGDRAGVLGRDLAQHGAVEAHVVADDSDTPDTGTRLCGYGDYHDGHEWTSRPDVWCPGYSLTDTQQEA